MEKHAVPQTEHTMTPETMSSFVCRERDAGASVNMLRRYKCTLNAVYEYLPEDKRLNWERLRQWRKGMEEAGYSSQTILNYVKYINKYLDFVGCSDIRFNKGRAKDISEMTFGYLTAKYPTVKRDRGDIVWVCECRCGKIVEFPATRLLLGNTRSCGCLQREIFQRVNKYIDKTSIRQALDETVVSTRSESGYVGVTRKRDKWHAYIKYKGVHYSLGSYYDIEDAVRARARAKELVVADAQGLLNFYDEIHKNDPIVPNRDSMPSVETPAAEWCANSEPATAARRRDNTSGYPGVTKRRGLWESKLAYRGIRYVLGSFKQIEDAIEARRRAEQDLRDNPDGFEKIYTAKYRHYTYRSRKGE